MVPVRTRLQWGLVSRLAYRYIDAFFVFTAGQLFHMGGALRPAGLPYFPVIYLGKYLLV